MEQLYAYIAMWDSVADARADLAIAADLLPDDLSVKQFIRSYCVAPLAIWRKSQDTVDGEGNTVHNYIAPPDPGPTDKVAAMVILRRRRTILDNADATQLVLDVAKMNAREPGYVIQRAYSPAILLDVRWAPRPMGIDVPFGGLN